MSNFSQFFPAGSGGSGGSGINSYAPFSVSPDDNNPQGYIASTGLYTNPVDDSVWLKTGNTVGDTTNTYPNAKFSPSTWNYDAAGNIASPDANTIRGITWDGTHYWTLNSTTGPVVQRDTTLTLTGTSFTITGTTSDAHSIAWDSVQGTFWIFDAAKAGTTVTHDEYSAGGVATGRVISYIVGNDFGSGTVHNGFLYVTGRSGAATTTTTTKYNTSTLASVGSNTPSTSNSAYRSIFHDGGNSLWIAGNGTWYEQRDDMTGETGRTFTGGPTTPGESDSTIGHTGDMYQSYESAVGVYNFAPTGNLVGDPVARTDTDSTQPLFIKLK